MGGGGGSSAPKESKSDKKKRKEQEKREEELFELQKQQIAQSQAEAEKARQVQIEQTRKIQNREAYESIVSRANADYRDYINPFDPKSDYTNPNVKKRVLTSAQGLYRNDLAKKAAAEKQAATEEKKAEAEAKAEAEQLRIERMVPPAPTEYGATAQEAAQDVRRNEKRRRGIGATILAGETGGYDTEATTLLG